MLVSVVRQAPFWTGAQSVLTTTQVGAELRRVFAFGRKIRIVDGQLLTRCSSFGFIWFVYRRLRVEMVWQSKCSKQWLML